MLRVSRVDTGQSEGEEVTLEMWFATGIGSGFAIRCRSYLDLC